MAYAMSENGYQVQMLWARRFLTLKEPPLTKCPSTKCPSTKSPLQKKQ